MVAVGFGAPWLSGGRAQSRSERSWSIDLGQQIRNECGHVVPIHRESLS